MPTTIARPELIVRDATAQDMPAIQRIYSFYVLNSLATFEEAPPSIEELANRRATIVGAGLTYIAAELDGIVVGYAYASPYRSRAAYLHTIEDSVYVTHELAGKGIGRALLGTLISRCEAGHWRQCVAVIGDGQSAASVALHERLGFRRVGVLVSVGFKLGRWVDTIVMQRALGGGNSSLPKGKQAPPAC
jgi:L-amino acid N-acyltransferase YncA